MTNRCLVKQGDCVNLIKDLSDSSVDLVVTSPPYDTLRKYQGYSFDFKSLAKELYRVIKDGGVVVWIVSDKTINGSESLTSFKQAIYFNEIGFNVYDTMIWRKPNPSVPTEGRYYNAFEYMFVLSKGKPKSLNFICDKENKGYGKTYYSDTRMNPEERKKNTIKKTVGQYSRRHNVWDIAIGNNPTKHPAVFPLQLVKDHIVTWSEENDLVLDPFAGSGTTGIACIQTNRNFIGFEISEDYCLMANERIFTELGNK